MTTLIAALSIYVVKNSLGLITQTFLPRVERECVTPGELKVLLPGNLRIAAAKEG